MYDDITYIKHRDDVRLQAKQRAREARTIRGDAEEELQPAMDIAEVKSPRALIERLTKANHDGKLRHLPPEDAKRLADAVDALGRWQRADEAVTHFDRIEAHVNDLGPAGGGDWTDLEDEDRYVRLSMGTVVALYEEYTDSDEGRDAYPGLARMSLATEAAGFSTVLKG